MQESRMKTELCSLISHCPAWSNSLPFIDEELPDYCLRKPSTASHTFTPRYHPDIPHLTSSLIVVKLKS